MDPPLSSEQLSLSLPTHVVTNEKTLWFRYGIAIGSLAATVLIHVLLDDVIEDNNRFILYLPAVLLSVWFSGFGPGILAFILGGIAGIFITVSPTFSFNLFHTADSVGLALYLTVGGLIVFLPKAKRHVQYQAQAKQRQLEAEVMDSKRRDEQHAQLLLVEQRARMKAEKDDGLKSQFVAMVAHELRTPLTTIKGFASSLLAEDVTWNAADQHHFFQIIDEEADRLNEMVDQLLDLTQLQSGKMRIHAQEYGLPEIISLAQTDLESLAAKHHLTMNIPQDLPPILADSMRLSQVLLNLVGNAAKYSPLNTSITVTAKKQDNQIQVDVADEGSGIPTEQRKVIFDIFKQLENTSGQFIKGSGLGLAICKGLVEAHGGMIWVGDQPTTGTVMSFTVPFATSVPTPLSM